MIDNLMSFKAKIRNFSLKKGITAQVVLQNFVIERFLERISKSIYVDNYVIKGGILIASIVGIDKRSTMDLDTTIIRTKLNEEFLLESIQSICSINLNDNLMYEMYNISHIRKDDIYWGYRVSIKSRFDKIEVSFQIDITTGDVMTPKEKEFVFNKLFNEGVFKLNAYNIETILAEKVETVLSRVEFNTRPRDFYDIYILTKTQVFNKKEFQLSLNNTAFHRNSLEKIQNHINIIEEIKKSEILENRWNKYRKDYKYASDISYEDVIESLISLIN